MMQRVTVAFFCFLLAQAPALAGAQDDEESGSLDDLMAGDPEAGEGDDEGGDNEGGDDEGGDDKEAGSVSDDGFDENMDDERPPGDPDAFVTLKDKRESEAPEVEETDDPPMFSVALTLGYGVSMEDINPWGFGFGAVFGIDLGLVSLGVRGGYFLGESIEEPNEDVFGFTGGTTTYTANLFELGVEAGLDIDVSPAVTIRPALGAGLAAVSTRAGTNMNPFFAPALALVYNASESMFVGLNGRFQLVGSDPSIAGFITMVNAGMRF